MKTKGVNPYLPSWEYIPDGEPHVFDGRVYVYGSHDEFGAQVYCTNDYVCWSAPVDDLTDWRYEGVTYERSQDPRNKDGKMCLFAPDVTRGPDGRYYMYYVLNQVEIVSVAVCGTPAGKYQFYGYVHHEDGTPLGERKGDWAQFDPGVLTEGKVTYMYTGFCPREDSSRKGAMVTVLAEDMLTVKEEPVIVMPSVHGWKDEKTKDHAFFEASSIRKVGDTYYFIYSSVVNHELCYATSKSPIGGFTYRGVIVSNSDLHIDSYKPAEMPAYYGGNNHGSIVQIKDAYYIFHHRHTNGSNFARQGLVEKIEILEDGSIPQVPMTSCGPNGAPLEGKGEYPTYIACNLWCAKQEAVTGWEWMGPEFPKITQDGRDGDEVMGYICNMKDGATAGFKYFDIQDVSTITLKTRGYGKGFFEVRTSIEGEPVARINIEAANYWESFTGEIKLEKGVYALYLTYRGLSSTNLQSFCLN